MNPRQVLRIKRWLAENGYDIGKMDGVAGARFIAAYNSALQTQAFKRFLRGNDLPTEPLTGSNQPEQPNMPGGWWGVPSPSGPSTATPETAPPATPGGWWNWPTPGVPGTTPPEPGEGPGTEEPGEETPETPAFNNDLMARIRDLLGQMGLDTPGLLAFARDAIARGLSFEEIKFGIREHPDYLANPLFAANLERAKNGGGFMAEGQVIAWAAEARRLARQYGFQEPSDNYIAEAIRGGRSIAEIEHRIRINRRVLEGGPGMQAVAEEMLGASLTDEDLFEIFDDEIDTHEWDQALRYASYRGRPFLLGLGIRSEAEARALEMLGVSEEEAFSRFQGVAANKSRFERLRAIENPIVGNLPADFGAFMTGVDNGLLVRALVFQDPQALAELQQMSAREIARHNQGGGPAMTSTGAAVGLLAPDQRR